MTHHLTLLRREPVTHDTHRLRFARPEGVHFTPGQATELHLDRDGWRDEGRPFTFTSLPDWDELEFTIKSYPDRGGVTAQIPTLQPGEAVTITDPFGAIEDKGPGTFIAGGAGITPFIAVLRARLEREGDLGGSQLIFSNSTQADIILKDEWDKMPGLACVFPITGEDAEGHPSGQVDGDFLEETVTDWQSPFYVCGPPPLEEVVLGYLEDRKGIARDRLVTDHWG